MLVAAKGSSTTTAERFVVVDANGETRAILGTDGLNPSLTLFDGAGASATLAIQAGSPSLALLHPDERLTLSPSRPSAAKQAVSEPVEEPAADSAPGTDSLVIRLAEDAPFTAVEVVCYDNGYRARVSISDDMAVFEDVPEGEECRVLFKGGGPLTANAHAGTEVFCEFHGTQAYCSGT